VLARSHEENKHEATPSGSVAEGSVLDAVDESGNKLRFRVDGVEPDPRDKDGDVSLYTLSILQEGKEPEPYCAPDGEGKRLAIPVKGSWDHRGGFHDDPSRITFACTSGAIAKCIRFGYKPWKMAAGKSLAEHHAACMRMVRADYCGDGISHTKDGTRIDLWDEVGVQSRDEVTAQPEVFEAAWSPDGAAYLSKPRWSEDVEDIVQLCPDKLRGRTAKDVTLAPTDISKHFPEAKLFNARFIRDEDRMQKPAL
jgi:hypothetical protein